MNRQAAARTAVPAAERDVAAAWTRWIGRQRLTGNGAVADSAHPELMNRWTWYVAHDWSRPYPGDSRILYPAQVPGGALPATDD